MLSVGIRELKTQTSQIMRRVREQSERVQVTYRGQAIAHIVPLAPQKPKEDEVQAWWTDMEQLSAEIGQKWPADVSAVEAVREGRRTL